MDEKKLMEQYDKMNRKMQRHFASYFSDSPLTCIQGIVLHYIIVENVRRDIFPKDLEQGGYLRRESLESDGRYKKLVLTEKTKAMQEDIVRRVFDYMHSMFVGIPEEHLKIFESVILQMAKNAEK